MATALDAVGSQPGAAMRAVATAAGLSAILEPPVDLAVWQRPTPPGLAALLDARGPAALPHVRLEVVKVGEVATGLAAALADGVGPLVPLVEDVAGLARLYGRLLGRERIRVRLETITSDACSRFHTDRVRVRLLTTYVGPGTEWLDADERGGIRRLDRFAVALLKGSLWPGGRGCAQRSPPIAGTGRHRLLLCIDDGPGR